MNHTESQNGQRVYVWIVASCTLLLIGLLLWPLTVREFRATTTFTLKYEPTAGIEKTSLNSWVVDILRQQTSRSSIADIVSGLDGTMSSSVISSLDPEQIRKAIDIQGRPGDAANSMQYKLSLTGDGSEYEVQFINAIVSRINQRLDQRMRSQNNIQVIESMTEDFSAFHTARMEQVSGQLATVIAELNAARRDLGIALTDLRSGDSPLRMDDVHARPTNKELQNLQAARKNLLAQPGMTEFHPQVAVIQKRIEALQNNPAESGPAIGGMDRNSQFIQNQYMDPANQDSDATEQFSASAEDIGTHLELIDLDTPADRIEHALQSMTDQNGKDLLMGRLNSRAIEQLDYTSPVAMAGFDFARRSSPIGGAPSTSQFIWLFLLSAVFGSVVALNYDPALRKRRFRSVEQLQRKLNLPVIGVLRSRTIETPRPLGKRIAVTVVQVCEWALLAVIVLLILAALVNSEVAVAFIENPFHGITRTIWLMSPTN